MRAKRFNNMKLWITIVIASILLCYNSCNSGNDQQITIKGEYKEGLEVGKWEYLNSQNKILEEGYFDKGIRVGLWKYFVPYEHTIEWRKFQNSNNTIVTNIPYFFDTNMDSDSLIYCRYHDTASFFNLVIAKSRFINLKEYERQLYNDLKDQNFKITDTSSQYIETNNGRKYLYQMVTGIRTTKNIRIFNIIGLDSHNRALEVSVRAEENYLEKARIIFFSVISNLFLNSTRFIDGRDVISKFNTSTVSISQGKECSITKLL
jgi:hypothetical protein